LIANGMAQSADGPDPVAACFSDSIESGHGVLF
jgi:hypothetical protein